MDAGEDERGRAVDKEVEGERRYKGQERARRSEVEENVFVKDNLL